MTKAYIASTGRVCASAGPSNKRQWQRERDGLKFIYNISIVNFIYPAAVTTQCRVIHDDLNQNGTHCFIGK